MAIPLHLLVAAAKIAKDPNTIKTVKSIYEMGSKAVDKHQSRKSAKIRVEPQKQPKRSLFGKVKAEPPPEPLPVPEKRESRLRAAFAKKIRFRKGASGDLIRFVYTDPDGLKSTRTVGNWSSDGKALSGYCLNRKAERSFLLSGISDCEDLG